MVPVLDVMFNGLIAGRGVDWRRDTFELNESQNVLVLKFSVIVAGVVVPEQVWRDFSQEASHQQGTLPAVHVNELVIGN